LRDAELGSAGEQAFVNAHVVDYASLPVKPKFQRLLLIILAVPGGLILGFCIAFLREYLDGRVKDEAEAETALGVPGFGSVPAMGWLQSLRANP
jgi:capsular polysaccharide biosynthesis protein